MIKLRFFWGVSIIFLISSHFVSAQECQLQPDAPKAAKASVLSVEVIPDEMQPLLKGAELANVENCTISPSSRKHYTTNIHYRTTPFIFIVDSAQSKVSTFTLLSKMANHNLHDTEVKVYVRSDSRNAYTRLLSAIIDKSQKSPFISVRYNHELVDSHVRDGIVFVSNLDEHGNVIGTTSFLPFVYKDGVYPVP